MNSLAVVILAAGQGTRMKSTTPKVLHKVAGWPMLRHVLTAAAKTAPSDMVVVVGHGAKQVEETIGNGVRYVIQAEQLGTGHAVAQAKAALEGTCQHVLILYGDTPLIQGDTLLELLGRHHDTTAAVTMITGLAADPTGYGRILRDDNGKVIAIVEEKAASASEKSINEINSGVYCFQSEWLWPRLSQLKLSEKGEYYLTDLIDMAVREGRQVETVRLRDTQETAGINNREQLAEAEAVLRWRVRRQLMHAGVTMIDPNTTYVDATVQIAPDTIIYPNCMIEGQTSIGANCVIGPNSQIVDSTIGDGCQIKSSVIEQSRLAKDVHVGPFSHIRNGAELAEGVYIGNFAEIKKSRLGPDTKMHHFSYLGDAQVGERVNIGAGTITCNFNSETGQKSATVLEDDVAVGSDTMLVAPLTIGATSTTGAGSVVTHDLPAGVVAVGAPARVVRPVKKKSK